MKSFTFLPRVILGLLLFVTGGGISLAADTYVTNTVNGRTYTFTVTSTKDKTVSLSKIGGTDLASYTGTSIDLATDYQNGTFTVDGTTYTITSMVAMSGNKTLQTVKMPSTVTSLPSSCFDGCSALTTVSFPGIKKIGDYAFQNCSALTGTLTIPSGAYVGNEAFNGTGYTSLVINTGTTDNATSFYGYAFSNMSGVTEVKIVNDGSNKIPDNTFKGAAFSKDGVTLEIDNTITAIGKYAFNNAKFPKTLNLKQFTSIGSHAFDGNTTLADKDVTFAENTTIGEAAFSGCTSLEGELTIPKGTYNNRVFDGCKKVTELVIYTGSKISYPWNNYGCFGNMQGVTKVTLKDDDDGDHTIPAHFFGHASFSTAGVDLTIPESITAIGDGAFYSANFPTKLDLSSQFTSYGASAFEDNTAFKGNNGDGIIAVQKPKSATSDVKVDSKAFSNTGATEIDIYPNVDYSACKPRDDNYPYGHGPYNGTNINTIKFTDGITSVPDYVFLNASDIPSTCTVTWPTDPTHIGKGAFYGVKFRAAIPSKMSGEGTIGEYAYAHNTMSGEITIPTGCIDIGSRALYDCENITKITVPSTTTSIGDFAFSDCAALASVELPTLTSGDPQLTLGGGFIANDPKLTAFTITNAVKTIYCCSWGNRNDASFSALTTPFTVTLASDKVKASAENRTGGTFFTFEKDGTTDNPNTLTIQVANGVTSIPDELFSENASGNLRQSYIDKIVLSGSDVKSIGTKSFYHIRTLLSVDMSGAPEIASIGESAFADCAQLTTVTFGDASKITTIGASAFSGCKALASLNQKSDGNNDLSKSSLAKIESQAFANCTSLANIYFPSTLMRISSDAFSGAKAATDDMVFIKADVPYAVNTFCRGFGVKMNSKDGLDALTAGDQSFSMWVPVKVDKVKRQLVLRPFVGDYLPSEEPKSADVQNTSTSYSDVPAGIIFAPSTWSDSQYTPYDEEGDPTTHATKTNGRQLNLRVKFTDKTTTVAHSHSTGALSKSLLRGYIDTLKMSGVSNKYLIWTADLALHPVAEGMTFPAGKCYIYDDPNASDEGSGNITSAKGFQIFLSDEPIYDGNTITGIKDIQRQNVNVDDNYYTLDGKIVSFPTEGIYIHHGKKVIIRRI
jgi:hypothetical protein